METLKVDKSFTQLMDVIQKIIDTKQSGNVVSTNPIYKYYRKFKRIYSELKEEEKREIVSEVYEKFRDDIVAGKDEWLLNGSPSFGYDKMKICIGIFYNYAVEIKENTKKELEGLPESAYQNRTELIYPEILKLHVYRIFAAFEKDSNVKKQISKTIEDLEDELGIETGSNVKDAPKNPMEGMINMMSSMMSNMNSNGNVGPSGEIPKTPDMNQLGSIFQSIFGNPDTQQQIGGILNNFKDVKEPQDLFTKMGSVFQDPKVQNLVQGMVEGIDPEKRSAKLNEVKSELDDPDQLLADTNDLIEDNNSEEKE